MGSILNNWKNKMNEPRKPIYQIMVEPFDTKVSVVDRSVRMDTTIGTRRVHVTDTIGTFEDVPTIHHDRLTNEFNDLVKGNFGRTITYSVYEDGTSSHEVSEE
jgi:hypothetical protein